MAKRPAIAVAFDNSDRAFFKEHPDRQAHIRLPYEQESAGEFWSLGDHNRTRRRILLWRVPKGNPYYHPEKAPFLKIPFLAFSDETIEDNDVILLPIIDEIMEGAYIQHSAKAGN